MKFQHFWLLWKKHLAIPGKFQYFPPLEKNPSATHAFNMTSRATFSDKLVSIKKEIVLVQIVPRDRKLCYLLLKKIYLNRLIETYTYSIY